MFEESCSSKADYVRILGRRWVRESREYELHLARVNKRRKRWVFEGYCSACHATTMLRVDRRWGARREGGVWIPNWRERMECPTCRLNGRQRYIAGLLQDAVAERSKPRVYMTEQLTRFFQWARGALVLDELTGSEYLPDEKSRRLLPPNVRHEDVEDLSFETASFDVVVSNDVLEHVNDPDRAARELARVLRPGGIALITIPLHSDRDESVTRARLVDGQIEHLLEPVYHGNPVDSQRGSLVFTDFGWDVVERFRSAGFERFEAHVYWSRMHGYLGGPSPVLRGER